MKLHYYAETDSLYIELRDGAGVEVREIVDGLNADIDAEGHGRGCGETNRACDEPCGYRRLYPLASNLD